MSRTILCVEDEQDTGDLLQTILEREGYHVVRASDGRQAICLIETMLPPALILLDVVVPYVNGFELLTGLRANPDWGNIPIVMLSADSYGPDIQRALNDGATAYVVKQPGFQELIQTLNRILVPASAAKPTLADPSRPYRVRSRRPPGKTTAATSVDATARGTSPEPK